MECVQHTEKMNLILIRYKMKKTIEYKKWWKKYKLWFMLGNYCENNNLYLWILDWKGEQFCDVSCNYWALGTNEIQLDHDFLDITPDLKDILVNEWIMKINGLGIYRVNIDKIKSEYKFYQCND